jgi:hypothetical protein
MADCPLKLPVGASAQLSYGPRFSRDALTLLEVDEETLKEIVARGVVIKGAPAQEAVLCTAHKTFALKQVETSNTLLLVPPRVRAAFWRAASVACAAARRVTRRGTARRVPGGG